MLRKNKQSKTTKSTKEVHLVPPIQDQSPGATEHLDGTMSAVAPPSCGGAWGGGVLNLKLIIVSPARLGMLCRSSNVW